MKETIRQKVLETKRRIILEEAARIFESEGFAALKIQEIAEKLGMSVGALYNMFGSKEGLYLAYVEDQIRRFQEQLVQACAASPDARACLIHFVRLKFAAFSQKRKAVEDPAGGDPLFFLKTNSRLAETIRPIYDHLAALFEKLHESQPLKERDFLKIAHLFNAFTTGYVEYWLSCEKSLDESPETVVARFLEGMKA